jgi:hypothetical protein
MKNSRTILSLALLLLPFVMMAQTKVVDASGKKPEWVSSMSTGYIIGRGSGPDMKTAQEKAMNDVRRQITESVAVHVKSLSQSMVNQLMMEEKTELTSEFNRVTSTRTGKRDFLKGISPSRVDDFYWEKILHKKTKEEYFTYAVKYPFNQMELMELVAEFERKDQALTDHLNALLETIENFNSIEELETCISQLEKLVPLFIDERKNHAQVGIETCRGLLKSVYIADVASKPGWVAYSLKVGDRVVTTSKTAQISSNCADIVNKHLGEKVNRIEYDDTYCYDEPGNHVAVVYRISGKYVKKEFPINADAGEVSFSLQGDIHLYPDKGQIGFNLTSETDTPFVISSIELENEVAGFRVYENCNYTVDRKGLHEVMLQVNPFEVKSGYSAMEVNGYVNYMVEEDGRKENIRVYRHRARVLK